MYLNMNTTKKGKYTVIIFTNVTAEKNFSLFTLHSSLLYDSLC